MNQTMRLVMLSLFSIVVLAGCKTKSDTKTDPNGGGGYTPPTSNTGGGNKSGNDSNILDTDACLRQRVVYFDFDQYSVRPEFQEIMNCHAKYLRDRPSARVSLEGHTDERGSREYNLGLGERRSNAAVSALQMSGASGSQLTSVSYGEERPTCNDSNDACWSKNRRVEIVYTAK